MNDVILVAIAVFLVANALEKKIAFGLLVDFFFYNVELFVCNELRRYKLGRGRKMDSFHLGN